MHLVIVESPTKARTIGKFLGKDFVIKASMGHVMDLPKSKLSVDVDHDFKPLYEIMPDKKAIIADLKKSAKTADLIILATDPDREGEAIAAHIADILTMEGRKWKVGVEDRKSKIDTFNLQSSILKKPSSTVYHLPSIQRIAFHEITKEAIEEALLNPGIVNKNLVNAQTARRVLDRLVGYKLSPLLWQKVRRGLSAGRVQSVALRLIVEREREIERFKKEEYFTIHVILDKASMTDQGVEFELIEINGKKIESSEKFTLYDGEYAITKTVLSTKERAHEILGDIKDKNFTVADVVQKEMRRAPQPPYTTSTLQQDGSRRLGLNAKRTMSLAQKLYEEGYITYHRTDSVNMAKSAQVAIADYVKNEFGGKYLPLAPRVYSAKQKLAQEAHEAIRPTRADGIQNSKFKIQNELGNQGWKLYEMIWKRAVASQMSDAIIESTAVLVDVKGNDTYRLKTNGSVLVFDGFLRVNPFALSDKKLPIYQVGDKLSALKIESIAHETPPPPRYNDASLIKTLEEKGIGRPSTYASIVSTIETRKYIDRGDPVTGTGRAFVPTAIGNAVTDFLVANFPEVDDIPFTAQMEDMLDDVANGKKEWIPEIKKFYTPFAKKFESVKEKGKRVKIQVEELDEKCPDCGQGLVIRVGKFGKFISCGTFPQCKYSSQYVEKAGKNCPKCGTLPDGKHGEIIVRKTRKGRVFYGCSNYPACDFAVWKITDIP